MENAGISYQKLRLAIGFLGLALPILVCAETQIVGKCHCLQDSISHYYYTAGNSFFVGILWGLGLVLLFYPTYKNDPKNEGPLTTIAGLCAIVVSVFPTTPLSHDSCSVMMCNSPWESTGIRTWIHFLSAGTMLLIFSYMSVFIFTKTNPSNQNRLGTYKNRWKNRRNWIYRITGIITFLSVVLITIFSVIEHNSWFPFTSKYTFWLEVSALVSFGISWIIKGKFAFTDEGDRSSMEQMKIFFTPKKIKHPKSDPSENPIQSKH